jgi:hypothetical protein
VWYRHLAFPLTQLANAGIALILWVLVGRLADTQAQRVAISSYAFGTPASLAANLGIAYVLPNAFRSEEAELRNVAGPWSTPLRIALMSSSLVCLAGVFMSLLPGLSYPMQITAATLAMAGMTAAGVTLAQIGRIVGKLGFAIAGQFAVPATAGIWLITIYVSEDETQVVRVFCTLAATLLAIFVYLSRPYLAQYPRDSELLKRLMTASAILMPHLLLFGVVIQGVRISAAVGNGGPGEVQTAHMFMLAVSIGLTLLASINAYVAPNLQAMSESAYTRHLNRALIIFAASGVGSVVGVCLAIWIFGKLSFLPDVDANCYIYAAIALLSIAAYYSISAQSMRHLQTGNLTLSSAGGAIALVAPTILSVDLDFNDMVANFAGSTLVLVWLMTVRATVGQCEIRCSLAIPSILGLIWISTFFL